MWRSSLSTVERYDNIQKLKKTLKSEAKAIETEAEAFKVSNSKVRPVVKGHVLLDSLRMVIPENYDKACYISNEDIFFNKVEMVPEQKSPGIPIGEYESCHRIITGFCSDVYRCRSLALKVITQTHNIEPHNPGLEIEILSGLSHPSIIKLMNVFYNSDNRPVLVFPYQPFTLSDLLSTSAIPQHLIINFFGSLFSALNYLHTQEIIHRDIKPSNVLLTSHSGPALLSDFGTAWHPTLSLPLEPPTHKFLEVGTTAYRAPETLFGNRNYDTSLDIWSCGTMLAECLRTPPQTLFQSRETCEEGNQLGLIFSMFKTLGTPTKETWPEACAFSTPPFDWYKQFPVREWNAILGGVNPLGVDLVRGLIVWESRLRLTAAEALEHAYFKQAKRCHSK